jgi:DNA helicase-2/ATP-dependent DNA helicase PcrA
LLRELHEDKTVEGLARYENVQELLNAIKEFVDQADQDEDVTLSAFLQSVSLLTNADEPDEDGDNDRVTLMTIHSAKGLEFRNVYIVGMEEDLFPSQMMLESRQDLEEERRLFYVAITRAEVKLTLAFAESRYQWGRLKMCEPSRFLMEVDPRFLNLQGVASDSGPSRGQETPRSGVRTFTQKTPAQNLSPRPQPAPIHTPSSDFVPSDTSGLAVGQRVEHQKFGFGTVAKIDANGSDRKAVIAFDEAGERTLLLSFAKLRIVE